MRTMVRAVLAVACLSGVTSLLNAQVEYSTWTAKQATAIGSGAYVQGRVGGRFDGRILKTERAQNYKLAATWMTPSVIRASARLIQLAERLPDQQTAALIAEAEKHNSTVVMVEIDPREGSGVIPNDWAAFLEPITNGVHGKPVRGVDTPKLRDVKALAGVLRRNYDYDRFWVVFPLKHEDGEAVLPANFSEAQLTVRIYDREGTVRWPAQVMRR
jgi:hypothetical protein